MIAWHYTTGDKFEMIIADGVLKPAIAGVLPPELPIVWFSIHQYFEPTAKKGFSRGDGGFRQASIEEMMRLAGGLYRFGRPIVGLKCGDRLRKEAKMQLRDWKKLLLSARMLKGNPADWFGHVGDALSIDGMVIEKMTEDQRWRSFESIDF